MSSLTITTAKNGSIETLRNREVVVKTPISEKALAVFLRCQPEELHLAAESQRVQPLMIPKGLNGKKATFYEIDAFPNLVHGLQQQAKGILNQQEGHLDWLVGIDTALEKFNILLPGGSSLTFSRM